MRFLPSHERHQFTLENTHSMSIVFWCCCCCCYCSLSFSLCKINTKMINWPFFKFKSNSFVDLVFTIQKFHYLIQRRFLKNSFPSSVVHIFTSLCSLFIFYQNHLTKSFDAQRRFLTCTIETTPIKIIFQKLKIQLKKSYSK